MVTGSPPDTIATRKIFVAYEDVIAEGGRPVETPLRRAVACAVLRNPWAGKGFVPDLWDEMNRVGKVLSAVLGERLLDVLGGPDGVHSFGKAAIVGLNGELEHGSGIIHCPDFGPRFRTMVGGEAGIAFVETRAAAGVAVSIPTTHKIRGATRAYYQSVDLALPDAPHADEIVIALAATNGPRPHARIGDLTTDPPRSA